MVKTVRTSKSAVPAGAFSSFKEVEERWVKTTMLEGDPIVDKKLGPKGSPPGLVANIPKGCEPSRSRSTSNREFPVSSFPVIAWTWCRYEPNEKSQMQRGETILQNILVLAAGQVFTRPEEKSLLNRTVTLAVFPGTGGYPGGRAGQGTSVALAPRGQRSRYRCSTQTQAGGLSEEDEGAKGQDGKGARGAQTCTGEEDG